MWSKNLYHEYIKNLFDKNKDAEYAEFSKRTLKSNYELVGIRMPVLQKEAKVLAKEYAEYLKYAEFNTYEEVMLYGLVVSNIKEYAEYKKYIKKYIPHIDSWGLVDSFIAKSKVIKNNLEENYEFILELTGSNKEFASRVGYIMLLDYYINDEYYKKIYKIINKNTNTDYYNEMAISWLLSELLVKYYNDTVKYMKDSKIDKFTYNKALQKARESYRISPEQKEELQSMKKK